MTKDTLVNHSNENSVRLKREISGKKKEGE